MRSLSSLSILWALTALTACNDEGAPKTTPVDPTTDTPSDTGTPSPTTDPTPTFTRTTPTDTAANPCADPLVASIPQPGVLARQDLRVEVSGGVGPFTFALGTNASGASINPVSGAYLAGTIPGVVDVVEVADTTCGLTTSVDIQVFLPLDVAPLGADILPNTAFTVQVAEGSGNSTCLPDSLPSGGTLVGCDYAAGPNLATDRLRVVDDLTGEVVLMTYHIVDSVSFHPWGDAWLLPLGHPHPIQVVGGTGEVDAVPDQPGITVTDDTLTGDVEGRYVVALTDLFTGQRSTVDVVVAAPRSAGALRDGERNDVFNLVTADLDADGFLDAVMSNVDGGVNAYLGGGVYVYRGGPNGLDTEPIQTFGDRSPNTQGGRSLAVGDIDGDGVLDLAWGAPFADVPGSNDRGVVRIHRGLGDGTFTPEPTWERWGDNGGDQLGYGLAICDIDGNGADDLVVSAGRGEDRGANPIFYDTGALHVYPGNPGGPSLDPAWSAYPAYPDGTDWVQRNTGFGYRMAAGDTDGDGRCDIAASNYSESLTDNVDYGVVWRFQGADLTGPPPVRASRVYTGATDSQFGIDLDFGDVDADGRDDLIVGARFDDTVTTNAGAAWLFIEADDDGRPAVEAIVASDARFSVQGDQSNEYVGWGVSLGDVDGDGADDVIVGGPLDEPLGELSQTGIVGWYPASEALTGGVVLLTDNTRLFTSPVQNSYLGVVVGLTDDADGDGLGDLLAVRARATIEGEGVDLGLGVQLNALETRDLAMPAGAAASFLGDRGSAAWIDVDDDGTLDLVAGAWSAPGETSAFNTGTVVVFTNDGGISPTPTETWPGPFNNGSNDRLGFAVSRAGDFDGDGHEDLAVVAWNEGKPTTFDPLVFANPDDCPGSVGGTGALWIHRGSASGVDPSPSFVAYGYSASDHIDRITALDFDGDGRSEVAFGAPGTSDTGGIGILRGRPSDPAGITVICDVETIFGVSSGSRMGADVAAAGDLDGDGCDELVAGADLDDLGFTNQGSVRVLWGDGPGCSGPAVTTLVHGQANSRLGDAVSAGGRIDADQVPDLFVGSYSYDDGGLTDRGAAWWVSGSWILGLARDPAPSWVLPADSATTTHTLAATERLMGDAAYEEAGRGVGLIADPTRPGRALVAFGRRFADDGAGGVTLWRVSNGSYESRPAAVVGGETLGPYGQLGDLVVGHPDEPWMAVGAPLGDGAWIDEGVIYPFEL